jgi:AcrR family transcriptional regulator
MPRHADPTLPSRIVEAAYALWRKDGDGAVTIRDVARRAKTTTPSVYAHFTDRAAILRAVRMLAHDRFVAVLAKSKSVIDACGRMLAFADEHPRDYELLFGYGFRDRVEPAVQAAQFAIFEGYIRQAGVPDREVRPTALAIRNLVHGTAMFRLAQDKPGPWWPESRAACLDACVLLLETRSTQRPASRGRRQPGGS